MQNHDSYKYEINTQNILRSTLIKLKASHDIVTIQSGVNEPLICMDSRNVEMNLQKDRHKTGFSPRDVGEGIDWTATSHIYLHVYRQELFSIAISYLQLLEL